MIIVKVEYIGKFAVIAAACINAGTRAVDCLCSRVRRLHKAYIPYPLDVFEVLPYFVERTPYNYRGVVKVLLYHLAPLRNEGAKRVYAVVLHTPAGKFAPYKIARLIAFVKIPLLEHLLMQSGAVKAERHGKPYILFKLLCLFCGINAVLVISLVEHKPLKDAFAVDFEFFAVVANSPQPEIAANPVVAENYFRIVQSAVANLPQMRFRKRYFENAAVFRFALGTADKSAFKKYVYLSLRTALGKYFRSDAFIFGVGIKFNSFYIILRSSFQPDRLPYARGARIKAPVRLRLLALLAAGDIFPYIVVHRNGNSVFALDRKRRYIRLERGVSARMLYGKPAVYVHLRDIVHRTEMQHKPFRQILPRQIYQS